MKKNMLAVLILIVSVVNLTLMAYICFTVVPNAQRTDTLITKMLQIIDLELESPLPQDAMVSWSIEDVVKVEMDEMTANLTIGEDGKSHFAIINSSLTVNTKDEDYATLGPKVEVMKSDIKSIIIKETSKHTFEEFNSAETREQVKQDVLADIQALFNSRMIVDCTVDFLFQ